MNQHIHCTPIVNDCHYWQQGNKCSANLKSWSLRDDFGSEAARQD